MPRKPPQLTEAEFGIMKSLWALGSATVADVRSLMRSETGADPAYTTVMTLLGRMEKKGAVRVDKTREPFVYRPAFQKASARRERLREFIRSVFDGRADELVLQLVEDEDLSEEDLRRIEKKLPREGA
jgi:BlaI family transcriptional regulator, penicillinase repressor